MDTPRLMRQQAQAGHAAAQLALGLRYASAGEHREAVRWLGRASAQGHAPAQYALSQHCAEGRGMARDHAQAMELLSRAAAQGHSEAVIALRQRESGLTGLLKRNRLLVHRRPSQRATHGTTGASSSSSSSSPSLSSASSSAARELAAAATYSLVGCTIDVELRRGSGGGWERLSGVAVSRPPSASARPGQVLLRLPPSPSGRAAAASFPRLYWSSVVMDPCVRRYSVTARVRPCRRAPAAEGSVIGASVSADAVGAAAADACAAAAHIAHEALGVSAQLVRQAQWRREHSAQPEWRGEAWKESWVSLARCLGVDDPGMLEHACKQVAAAAPGSWGGGRGHSSSSSSSSSSSRWLKRDG
eukprot:COSAG01_NODE_7915_length_2994_cov_16.350604_5_plen_359_part_00